VPKQRTAQQWTASLRHERTDILLTVPSATVATRKKRKRAAPFFSQFQRSLPLKVEAVVNSSLNVFGRVDVSMQTLDLNERVR
jgi:hypothetical protein